MGKLLWIIPVASAITEFLLEEGRRPESEKKTCRWKQSLECRGHKLRDAGSLQKIGKAKNGLLPGASRKSVVSADTFIWALWGPFQTSDLQNCKVINLLFYTTESVVICYSSN